MFGEVAEWIREACGLVLVVNDGAFRRRRNKRDQPTTLGKIGYKGPNASPSMPKVKLDLTSDELLTSRPVMRGISHPYSDTLAHTKVLCYSATDLFGEKLRALAERCRPRDLYDVVHMHRHPDLLGQAAAVRDVLARKADFAGIPVPTADSIRSSPFRAEIESEWQNMLGHQLPKPLVPFETFWSALDDVFAWLAGRRHSRPLPRAAFGELDNWSAPAAIASWRRRVPMELLRYAGANRLLVDVDYRAESGRQGVRRVEPYALRQSRAGNLLLFVVNDRGQLRSYRVDHIAGIRPTNVPFTPRFRVEF